MTNPSSAATVLLPSLYLAPVSYYSALFHANKAFIEIHDSYRKQSYRNRCTIAGANGPLSLIIPVEKPAGERGKMKDIRISNHDHWRHRHWNAILSAYNSTPFFRYYEDDFRPFFERKYDYLIDFNAALRQLICRLVGIETAVTCTTEYVKTPADGVSDLREAFHPKKKEERSCRPYYQVFAAKNGFIPNLSIIDLLFNMGNETRLYLIE